MNKIDTLSKYFVPFLLCLVALTQIYLVYNRNLTPWKGGGFGMFATIDRMERRPIQITAHSAGEKFIIDPQFLIRRNESLNKIKSIPTVSALNILTERALQITWGKDSVNEIDTRIDSFFLLIPTEPGVVKIDSVSVNVMKFSYDIKSNKIELKKLEIFLPKKNLSDDIR